MMAIYAARCVSILMLVLTLAAPACAERPADTPDAEQTWMRVRDVTTPRGDRGVSFEVAVRTFVPRAGEGPAVTLASAVHIGERRYYRRLQEMLDAFPLVLYEGVGPEGLGDEDEAITNAQRRERTENRLRLLAILIEQSARSSGAYPETLAGLARSLDADDPRRAGWVRTASTDGWGHPVAYTPPKHLALHAPRLQGTGAQPFDLTSRGADGAPGGAHADRDVSFAEQQPLTGTELGGGGAGVQQRLAETFRLSFQLDEMDESKPTWRNSDMSIDEVRRRIEQRGGDGSVIFSMLDGSDGLGFVVSGVLDLVQALPGAAQRGRLMIMELLPRADETLMKQSMPGGAAVVEVILNDRNEVVVDDLRELIASGDAPDRVAVIYGAGHMPDLAERLRRDLGYRAATPAEAPPIDGWIPAMRLNLDRAGITEQEHRLIRLSVLQQIAMLRDQPG